MKLKIIFLISVSISVILAQVKPEQYYLIQDEDSPNKINSVNPTSNSILDIIAIGDTVWLGTSRGVSVSFNRGESWSNFYGSGSFGTDNVSAVGYDRYTGMFWAATARSVEGVGGEDVSAGTGLKFTSDNGLTWTSIPQPVDHPDSNTVRYGINTLSALPVTVTEQNLTYDIAFTPGTVWITSFAGGCRKSEDLGQTWQRVVIPPDFLNSISPDDTLDFCLSPVGGNFCAEGNLNHRAFSVISVDDTTLYVGTAGGINKSTDNGISWVKFNHQNQSFPISGNFITALAFNNFNHTVWAATWKAEDEDEFYGVSSSNNGGESWQTFLNGERPHNFGFMGSHVIAATDNGPFRTTNSGSSWILPTEIIDVTTDPTSEIFLRTDIYYSADSEEDDIWLGSNDGLIKLTETALWRGQAKIYFAAETLKDNSTTYCYPNPFSPNQEQLKIIYSTDNQPANVTIRIFNYSMNYVRTVIQNAPRQRGENGPPDFWDGKDETGKVVPNGVYLYRVDIDDKDPLFGKIIVLR